MGVSRDRVGAGLAACCLLLGGVGATPVTRADAVTLPTLTSSGGGPVIGGGAAAQVTQQLFSFGRPDVQEADGSDAAQFITAASAIANPQLAAPFSPLRRMLSCQNNNSGFGARAFRRTDGLWGGAMLVIAKSTYSDADAMKACAQTNWRRATAGSDTAMCNDGWTYPNTFESRHGNVGYYVVLAGTTDDFCTMVNAKFKDEKSSGWP